jgi:hypothetical protein
MRKSTHFILLFQLLLVFSVPSLSALANDIKKSPLKPPAAQQKLGGEAKVTSAKDASTKGGSTKDSKGKRGSDAEGETAGRDNTLPQNASERVPCSPGNAIAGALGNAIGGLPGQLISGPPCR